MKLRVSILVIVWAIFSILHLICSFYVITPVLIKRVPIQHEALLLANVAAFPTFRLLAVELNIPPFIAIISNSALVGFGLALVTVLITPKHLRK